jgi:gliding motility-associated-like protein
MYRNCFLWALLLAANYAYSQLPILQWVKAVKTDPVSSNLTNYSNGRTVGTDAQGNVYSAGLFSNTMDFDPGPGKFTMTSGTGHSSVYILKLDAAGNFVWAKQIPTIVEFGDIELKVSADGTVCLASNLPDPADMDPGPGVQIMTPIGAKDAFVIKLDTDGNLLWAKQFGGPGDTVPVANVLEIDANNNVIICGLFNNTVDFDPGPGIFNLTSTAHLQAYIVKLAGNGNLIWAKQFGNSPVVYSGSHISDIRCDAQGNIYTTGEYKGSCDFDPGPGVYTLTCITSNDGFVSKLDPYGNFVWAKGLNGSNMGYMRARAVEIDGAGNLIVAGWFLGTFDLNPGTGVHNVTANPDDCFFLKLDANGIFLWAKTLGGSGSDTGNDLAIDNNDNIYIVGSFAPSVDFDPGPGNYFISQPNDYAEVLLKFNAGGNFIYVAPFQRTGNNYGSGLFRRMWVDATQNIYVTGAFSGIIDFDPGPNVSPLTSTTSQSPFVLKLGRCSNVTTSSLTVSTCSSYTLNNEIFDSSGTYIRTVPNASGCDSIITLHLTINKKFTQQTKTICEGEFFFAGGANQTAAGTYIDTLRTVPGCDSIVTTYLHVNPRPVPDLGPDKDLCSNTQLTISPGTFTNYLWQDSSTSKDFNINTAGIYWVQVTNNFNCIARDTFTVQNMLPVPANFLKEKDSICTYEQLELISANAYANYQWSNGSAVRNTTVKNPGIYSLTVTDGNGCRGTDSITVFLKQCMAGFYMPTAFTPNGDRKNDNIKPMLFGKVKKFQFAVYNRWGQMVFQTTEQFKAWDGKVSGIIQQTGVFVWTCTYQFEGEEQKTEKGTVTLIR